MSASVTKRLLGHYRDASFFQVEAGLEWYHEAALVAATLANDGKYSLEQTAGVVAVLSPRVHWRTNKRLAHYVVACHADGVPVTDVKGCIRGNIARAYRVLDGDLSAISGPKVTAFWRGILGDETVVTLDVWAYRAAIGRDYVGPGPLRRSVESSYRNAARRAGVNPRDFQAIVWVAVRGSAL